MLSASGKFTEFGLACVGTRQEFLTHQMGRELNDNGMFLLCIYIADERNKTGLGTHLAEPHWWWMCLKGFRSSQSKAGSPIWLQEPECLGTFHFEAHLRRKR